MTNPPIIAETCALCRRVILPKNPKARVQVAATETATVQVVICDKCSDMASVGRQITMNTHGNPPGDCYMRFDFAKSN